jgi:hypothetical protein
VWVELQRLVFWDIFFLEKAPAVAGAFFCLFMGFFEGGFGKCAFLAWCFGGEVVVDLW